MPNNHRKFVKVRKEGGSRVLALTPFLPPDWKIVKVKKVENQYTEEYDAVMLWIEKVA